MIALDASAAVLDDCPSESRSVPMAKRWKTIRSKGSSRCSERQECFAVDVTVFRSRPSGGSVRVRTPALRSMDERPEEAAVPSILSLWGVGGVASEVGGGGCCSLGRWRRWRHTGSSYRRRRRDAIRRRRRRRRCIRTAPSTPSSQTLGSRYFGSASIFYSVAIASLIGASSVYWIRKQELDEEIASGDGPRDTLFELCMLGSTSRQSAEEAFAEIAEWFRRVAFR